MTGRTTLLAGLLAMSGLASAGSSAEVSARTVTVVLRGQEQRLHLYGPPEGTPVLVASGDGGWIHLAPHVAEALAARGYLVVGLDSKAYLSSFTATVGGVSAAEVARDFGELARYARRPGGSLPMLVGVSEGAGLSVLAATDPAARASVQGVIALGLPDRNELAWRWRDSVIYVTHKAPDEPGFSAAEVIGHVAPLPLALIHSAHDEFAPLADAQHLFERAGQPKRLWVIDAANHNFSDRLPDFDQRLYEALDWIRGGAGVAR